MRKLENLKDWYEEKEAHISTMTLVGGFIFDSLTMKNIDSYWDNIWILINLLSVCICLVFINKSENEGDKSSWRHFWLFNILQFSFGAVLGASFVFYFRSASLAVSWPFILILLSAILANEYLKKHYQRLVFQITFLFFSFYIFLIFFIPLIINKVGAVVFLISGVVSLVLVYGVVTILRSISHEKFKESRLPLMRSMAGVYLVMNILYFTNLIPPIPLSLKDAGIYQNIEKTSSGEYILSGESQSWYKKYFKLRQEINWQEGESLYAYTAVYAPGSLSTDIVHEWQYKDMGGEWQTRSRIPLRLSGGRSNGFRTYSTKSSLNRGLWRVNVTTPRGQVLGRINFEIL